VKTLLLCCLFLPGCVYARYDPAGGVTIMRFGTDTKIGTMTAVDGPGGRAIKLEGYDQHSQAAELLERAAQLARGVP
jgi:hypothetical protein